jgi:hypothetical protein
VLLLDLLFLLLQLLAVSCNRKCQSETPICLSKPGFVGLKMHAGSSKGAAIKLTIAVALSCWFLRFLSTRGRAEHPPQAAVLSVDKGVPAHRTLPLVIEEQSPEPFWNEGDPQVLSLLFARSSLCTVATCFLKLALIMFLLYCCGCRYVCSFRRTCDTD